MHQPTSEMPDLRRLATHERVAAMTSWLRARGLVVEDAASAQRAWHAERKKINKADHRERERAAASSTASGPLPSSVQRSERRIAQRNAEEGRHLFGLFVHVPWSAWDGYDEGSGTQLGVVWDYNRDTKRFTVPRSTREDNDWPTGKVRRHYATTGCPVYQLS